MPEDLPFRRPWRWPNDAKIAVSIGLAFEAFEHHSQFGTAASAAQAVGHFSLSYADYGWKAGAWRLLDLLDDYEIKGQVYTNGLAATQHPNVVAALAEAGHEIVGHGWANDRRLSDDDPEALRSEIQRCTEALNAAAKSRPVGWLSPGYAGTGDSNEILASEGYLWVGDDASDDFPFVEQTAHGKIVVMPMTGWASNDLGMWIAPRNAPSIIWDGFKDTFDVLYDEGRRGSPKWTEIVLHCHVAGRPTLIPTIKRCLDYARQHEDVLFARRCDLADWTLRHEPEAATAAGQ